MMQYMKGKAKGEGNRKGGNSQGKKGGVRTTPRHPVTEKADRSGNTQRKKSSFKKPEDVDVEPATKEEVEEFLAVQEYDQKSKDKLLGIHPNFQRLVLNQGDVVSDSNPSSMLNYRCRRATEMMAEDW